MVTFKLARRRIPVKVGFHEVALSEVGNLCKTEAETQVGFDMESSFRGAACFYRRHMLVYAPSCPHQSEGPLADTVLLI